MTSGSAIFIGTTEGPVQVLSVLRETGDPPSAVFLNGGTSKMRISAAYREFVERPSGFVERICGHRAFRTDLSGRIDGGESWQLGMLVAHIVEADARLVRQAEDAGRVIWCSGSVRNVPGSPSDIAIGRIDSLPQKLQLSEEMFRAAEGRGVEVWVVLSEEDDASGVRELVARLCPSARVATFGRMPLAAFTAFWHGLDQSAAAVREGAAPRRDRLSGLKNRVAGSAWRMAAGVLLAAGLGGLAYFFFAENPASGELPKGAVTAPSGGKSSGGEVPATTLLLPAAVAATGNPEGEPEASWMESVEVQIRAFVTQAGDDCFSESAARLVETAFTLKQFRATAIDGKLCGGRLIVANRTAGPIVIGFAGLTNGGAGAQTIEPRQSDYLILGPSHGSARILVRRPQGGGADFSERLFSGAHGVDGAHKSTE